MKAAQTTIYHSQTIHVNSTIQSGLFRNYLFEPRSRNPKPSNEGKKDSQNVLNQEQMQLRSVGLAQVGFFSDFGGDHIFYPATTNQPFFKI
jgi:hypothetical protein